MRILSILAMSVFALAATAQSYTITGKIDAKYNGKEIALSEQAVFVDTVVVENGAFKFERNVDDQIVCCVQIPGNRRVRADIMAAPGAAVTVDFTQNPAYITDNGGLNDKLNEVNNAVAVAGSAVNAKIQELQSKGMPVNEIQAAVGADIEGIYDIYRKAIEDNKDNMVGAFVLGMVASEFYPTLGALDTMIGKVKYATKVPKVMMERDNLLKADATQAGKMFVDFSGFTVDGKDIKLSEYVGKGKYVLVDFWASWCGPCKAEIPNLVELQNKFGGDKFTVLGVNVWDEESKFKAALTAEGINYPQIFVPQGNKDDATALYGIRGIPQIILFGPDGVIVQRNLRGDAMKKLVEEKLK
ncbi:MAG: AhpC/TSA family protein [Bacteroidaceae bacterium]|nr:AhpC/TSA family protein [Bacteroidaceae bacterium]